MKNKIYTFWCFFIVVATFLLLYPAMYVCSWRKSWHVGVHYLDRIWAWLSFRLSFLPISVQYESTLQADQTYIYCPNHSSFLDIPSVTYALKYPFKYVGKSSMANVPLFGGIFTRVHIGVDRGKLRSRYNALQESANALKEGSSLVIYPEGGFSPNPPQLTRFKDGAFRLAIETQTPIVPISLLTVYKVFPDKTPLTMYRHEIKIIVHAPIETQGMQISQIDELRKRTEKIIQDSLLKV
jgi:1-acyl-sn-glycerol-3-phosphate acyltransferase